MILAVITVVECEDCPKVQILRHNVEYDTFEATWFNGLRYQFCPVCREKPHAEDRIAEDLASQAQAANAVRRYCGVQYVER